MATPKWKKFSDQELREIVGKCTSFPQVLKELGYTGNSGSTTAKLKEVFAEKNIDYSHFKGHAWNKKEVNESTNEFTTYNKSAIKDELIKERGHKCECCGISEWQNQPIVLQLHHIDGNSNYNVRDNLMLLCPNCHSQTDNWCNRKNINSKQITDSQFLEALENAPSICAACRELGITPNQNNYRRARKLIENSES